MCRNCDCCIQRQSKRKMEDDQFDSKNFSNEYDIDHMDNHENQLKLPISTDESESFESDNSSVSCETGFDNLQTQFIDLEKPNGEVYAQQDIRYRTVRSDKHLKSGRQRSIGDVVPEDQRNSETHFRPDMSENLIPYHPQSNIVDTKEQYRFRFELINMLPKVQGPINPRSIILISKKFFGLLLQNEGYGHDCSSVNVESISFMKYSKKIMKTLISRTLNYKIETSQGTKIMVLFNYWLESCKDSKTNDNLNRLYFKLTMPVFFYNAVYRIEEKIYYSLKQVGDYTKITNNAINTPCKSFKVSELLPPKLKPQRNPFQDFINAKEQEILDELTLVDETISLSKIISMFYKYIRNDLLFVNTGDARVFNPYMKNLLFFFPEVIVFIEWRAPLKNKSERQKYLEIEATHIKEILCKYDNCYKSGNKTEKEQKDSVKALELEIRNFRKFTSVTFVVHFENGEKVKVYQEALRLRYGSKNLIDIKTANAVFIISFIPQLIQKNIIHLIDLPYRTRAC